MCKFDIIIPTGAKDVSFVPRVVDFICRCFKDVEHIYILTNSKYFVRIRQRIPKTVLYTLVDENILLPDLSLVKVRDMLKVCCPNRKLNAGWYFQQFLKLGFAQSKYCKNYYLSWDADTLPLAPIKFFEDGHLLFNPKNEYNSNYFKAIERLFGYGKQTNYSFIAENMMFSKKIVSEMLTEIEKKEIEGFSWWEKILYASNLDNPMPAFSEFETYGTYCLMNYPNLYKPRYLNTFREAGFICGRYISENKLRILSFDLDTASFELGHAPMFPYNLPQVIYEKLGRLKKIKSMTLDELMRRVCKTLTHPQKIDRQAAMEQLYRLPKSPFK